MKAEWCLLLSLPFVGLLSQSCGEELDPASRMAEVSIQELAGAEYTGYQFAMKQQDGAYEVPLTTFVRGSQSIALTVPVGTYLITLNYFKDQNLVLSAAFCADGIRNDMRKLVAGKNDISLNICDSSRAPAESTVVIKPTPVTNPTSTPAPTTTFAIQDGRLLDASGKPFVFRGINMPFAYYFDQSLAAIDTAKASGFNAVRTVWCADNFLDPSKRCQQKDLRTPAELDRVLTRIEDRKLVTIFNLQNATGDNSIDSLQKMADYLVRADVKAVLIKHQKSVIINIANEWMGDWAKTRTWVDGYRQVIPKIRGAGLNHVLVVDARGYGQDFSSIEESAAELLALDRNLLFSSHMYAVYNSDQIVQEKLSFVRSRKIPYIIGEFGCSHYDDNTKANNPVACDAIIREAANASYPIGTLAWSFAGNRQEEAGLDVFNAGDWKTLTNYGQRVVNGANGVKATAKQACFFDAALCK